MIPSDNTNDNTNGSKAIPECSAETTALYKALSDLQEGEMLSYAKLSDIAFGEDVKVKKRHLLTSAVRKCLNDEIVIECVIGRGMKRMTNETIDSVADQARITINRKARKVKKALKAVDYDRLDQTQKLQHCARIAFTGAIALFSKPSAIKTLEDNQEKEAKPKPFDPAKTLKLFS